MNHIRNTVWLTILLAGAISFVACKKSGKDNNPPAGMIVQFIHSAPKVGTLDIELNKKLVATKISFAGQPLSTQVTQSGDVAFKITDAGGNIVLENKFQFVEGGNFIFFVTDTISSTTKRAKYILLPNKPVVTPTTSANLRFVHLSPTLPPVDVDIIQEKDSIRLASNAVYLAGQGQNVGEISFKRVAPGNYKVRVKIKGETKPILEVPVVNVPAGKQATLYLSGILNNADAYKLSVKII